MTKFFLICLVCSLGAIGALFLSKSNINPYPNLKFNDMLNIFFQTNFWIGILLSGSAFLLFTYLINVYNTGNTIITIQIIYLVIVFFLSVMFMNENFTLLKLVGISFMIFGLYLFSK